MTLSVPKNNDEHENPNLFIYLFINMSASINNPPLLTSDGALVISICNSLPITGAPNYGELSHTVDCSIQLI